MVDDDDDGNDGDDGDDVHVERDGGRKKRGEETSLKTGTAGRSPPHQVIPEARYFSPQERNAKQSSSARSTNGVFPSALSSPRLALILLLSPSRPARSRLAALFPPLLPFPSPSHSLSLSLVSSLSREGERSSVSNSSFVRASRT